MTAWMDYNVSLSTVEAVRHRWITLAAREPTGTHIHVLHGHWGKIHGREYDASWFVRQAPLVMEGTVARVKGWTLVSSNVRRGMSDERVESNDNARYSADWKFLPFC